MLQRNSTTFKRNAVYKRNMTKVCETRKSMRQYYEVVTKKSQQVKDQTTLSDETKKKEVFRVTWFLQSKCAFKKNWLS